VTPNDGTFVLDQTNLPAFTLSLDASVINTEAIYDYTITATADGTASATVDATMEVYNACVNTLASGVDLAPEFYLPHPDTDTGAAVTATEVVYASSAVYVDAPVTGCTQRFDY
jgi:hypothetical protein